MRYPDSIAMRRSYQEIPNRMVETIAYLMKHTPFLQIAPAQENAMDCRAGKSPCLSSTPSTNAGSHQGLSTGFREHLYR